MSPWVPMFVILGFTPPPQLLALFWEAVWPLVVGVYLEKMLIIKGQLIDLF